MPGPNHKSDDSPSEPTPLQSAIRSDLDAASWHADQVHYVQKLEAEALEDRKAEEEAGKRLFDIPSPHPQGLYREDSRRGDYLRRIMRYLYMPIAVPMSLVIAVAGMGKTRECEQELRRMAGKVVHYSALTHRLVDEVVADLQLSGYHHVYPVRGRTAEDMCVLEDIGELSADIAAAGLSVQAVLCGNPESSDDDEGECHVCPHFNECKYQAQRRTLASLEPPSDQPLIFVLPHQYLSTWPSFLREPDLKIIDESCWQQFVEKSKLQFADLVRIADKAPPVAQEVLRSITTALGAGPHLLKSLRSYDLTKRDDFRSAESWLTGQINRQAQDIAESGSRNFKPLLPWSATRHLVHQLSLEIEINRLKSHSVSFPDRERPSTKNLIGIYSRHPAGEQIPTMLLDASADADLYSRVFGKMKTHNITARRNAVFYQVRRRAFSRQSLLGVDAFGEPHWPEDAEKLRQDVFEFVIGRLENHKRVLVVAEKPVRELLEVLLQPQIAAGRVQLAHFNALRGLNSFKDCDAAVIVGRVQPPPGAVEAYARALFWDDPSPLLLGCDYSKLYSVRSMRDGTLEIEKIQKHPDPRINIILCQLREREIEQAFDRIRLIYESVPKTVYILTCIPTEAEITSTAPWPKFRDAGRSRIGRAILRSITQIGIITVGAQDYEAAVMPFGRELGRCNPKIWQSPESAKQSWDKGGGVNGVQMQMELLFGNGRHLLVTYRRPGKKTGRLPRALVAIRPVVTPQGPSADNSGLDFTNTECVSKGRNSGLDQDSADSLRAAAEIALKRLIKGAKVISVEPSVDNKSGR